MISNRVRMDGEMSGQMSSCTGGVWVDWRVGGRVGGCVIEGTMDEPLLS